MTPNLSSGTPATGFDDALARMTTLQALDDDPAVNPVCATRLFHHGARTRRVVVCFHGYTNCPAQYEQLGLRFHGAGANVLIPRLPHHGMRDRLSRANEQLRPGDLHMAAQNAIDIACGLGEEIVVTGLSAGGIMTAWAAQHRPEVTLALVVAPSLGLPGWPAWLSDSICWALQYLPNVYIWWDQKAKATILGAPYAYPRFSTRSLAAVVAFGREVRRAAVDQPPQARRIVIVGSPTDEAIQHRLVERLAAAWARHAPDRIERYAFPADWEIRHDMIDPTQPTQQVDKVYPVLMQLAFSASQAET